MPKHVPAAPQPLFIPISRFKEYGLPGHTKAYADAAAGRLNLIYFAGKTGVTPQEAERYVVEMSRPYVKGDPNRDVRPAVAARIAGRRTRA